MSVEEAKSIDNDQEVKKENGSTKGVDYTNPSGKITEKNDLLVQKDQESADDLLPESIINRKNKIEEKITDMKEWDVKNSYTKILGIIQTVIDAEDRSTANDLLTKVEARLNTNNIKTEKEIPAQKNAETKKEETKKPENTEEKQGQDVTRNAESKGNNRNWLEGLLNDEERMEENKWITVVQKNP